MRRLVLVGTAAAMALCMQAAAAQAVHPDGATLFHQSGCMQCHRLAGAGGDRGPDLSDIGKRRSKKEIRSQVVGGGGGMPAFGGVLPEADIEALVRYLQHCRKKPSAPMGSAATEAR